jgi:hypothetical protein
LIPTLSGFFASVRSLPARLPQAKQTSRLGLRLDGSAPWLFADSPLQNCLVFPPHFFFINDFGRISVSQAVYRIAFEKMRSRVRVLYPKIVPIIVCAANPESMLPMEWEHRGTE